MFILIDEKGSRHICEDCGQPGIKHWSDSWQFEGWYGRYFVQTKLLAQAWDVYPVNRANISERIAK